MAVRGNLKSEWEITSEEFSSYFIRYFHINSPGQHLSGEKARQFFLQTNIALHDLSQIWDLADIDGDGALDAAEFSVAMHLIQRYLQGFPLPTSLPPPLLHCYHVALRPHLPIATKEHVLKCKKVFEAFHKDLHKGVLSGEASRALMSRSNLTKDQIRHIWTLADQDEDEQFTFYEFTTAMHLIFVTKLGYILPMNLDPYSVLPPSIMTVVQEDAQEGHGVVGPTTPFVMPLSAKSNAHKSPLGPGVGHIEEDLHEREHRRRAMEGYTTNPFQTENLFDKSEELEAYMEHDTSPSHQPQKYQIRTGGRRGLEAQELSDSPYSMLSMIPEEDLEGMESPDSSLRSPDSRPGSRQHRSHEQSPVPIMDTRTKAESGRGIGSVTTSPLSPSPQGVEAWGNEDQEVPWYQESEDLWQTTPAYRSEGQGEWSNDNVSKNQTRRLSNVQKLFVTEEVVPVLQVAQSVEVARPSGPGMESPLPDLESDSDGEGLTNEDIEELDNITEASQKFLADLGANPAEADPNDYRGYKRELRAASIEGLEATIQTLTSPLSDHPHQSNNQSSVPVAMHSVSSVSEKPKTDQSDKHVSFLPSSRDAKHVSSLPSSRDAMKKENQGDKQKMEKREMLNRLEGLETEIRMSVLDTSEDSMVERGVAKRSHDQAAGPTGASVQWSCDCTQSTAAASRLVTTNGPSLDCYHEPQEPAMVSAKKKVPAMVSTKKKASKDKVQQDRRSQKAK